MKDWLVLDMCCVVNWVWEGSGILIERIWKLGKGLYD